ncbi:choice-of-anchor D domain-containing protein [Pontibacter qinzhouensis]|uniref:Choice-of-anchor D domain-containing protein n=1 Tax=Pontibacter qinzhouensis TaxID=2603253 RepID=A0A5C8KDP8_9BACT|nr:choice-of-anchor D domain-containing protein [Pontibacter qinzhouensis]TXK52865.1 choice-of-anchor D domain-containing protein [Pontibacter qinzhouensis]
MYLSEERTYSFGAVRVLEQGTPVPFTLTNVGLQDLHLTGTPAATITGRDPGDFSLDLGTMPAKLAPGAQVTFTITFKPAAGGPRFAELLLPTSDEESPLVIKLGGQGTRLETTITNLEDIVLKASAAPFQLNAKTNSTAPVTYSVVAGNGQVELSGENNSHVKIIKGGYVTIKANVEENDLYKAAFRLIVLTM